jgi:hypothetical protein
MRICLTAGTGKQPCRSTRCLPPHTPTRRRVALRFVFAGAVELRGNMMPNANDRCSFEVVYKKDTHGEEVIDSVIVRTGVSDAAVTLTIPQVYNLARLLDVIPEPEERPEEERTDIPLQGRPKAVVVRSDKEQVSLITSAVE